MQAETHPLVIYLSIAEPHALVVVESISLNQYIDSGIKI